MSDATGHGGTILVVASGFIYARTSTNNLGDRAQLTQTVERLRAAFPEFRLIALANSLNDEAPLDELEVSYAPIRYLTSPLIIAGSVRLPGGPARGVRVLLLLLNARRVARRKRTVLLPQAGKLALRQMKGSSALYLSGAGALNDLYLPTVGGFWAVLVRCMSILGKPVVASGQQVGPLKRLSMRAVARWALPSVDLLGVRDPRSIEIAAKVGVPESQLVLTGDDAWEFAPASVEEADEVLNRKGIQQPFIAAQIRFGPSVGWSERDAANFAASLSRVSSDLGLPIVFVPCGTALARDDRYAADCIRERLDVTSYAVVEELNARVTKALLGRAVVGVGTANHFCVFAASMGTPAVGLYATPYMEQKLTGLAQLWPNRVAALPKDEAMQPSNLVAVVRQLLEAASGMSGGGDEGPAIKLQSEEPIRFLSAMLSNTWKRQ